MMKLWIVGIGIALACAVGCSKTFMCHLNGTSCPASPQSPSNESSSESSEATPEENTSSQESEAKSEAKTEEAAPARTNCRPSGATCDQSYQCCSDACVTHSPDDYCR